MSTNVTKQGEIVPRTAAEGALKSEVTRTLSHLLLDIRPEIARALPKHIDADRMARIFATALRTTNKLANCTPMSFLGSVIQASQLGLEVNTPLGQAYLIPFKNMRLSEAAKQDIFECQLIVGYQGMIELSMRSGRLSSIDADVVRDGDVFEYESGLKPKLVHRPAEDDKREQRPLTHAYAIARYKDGAATFKVLSRAQLEAHRSRSRAKDSGPWKTDYAAMCCKTAIRAMWKYMPKSPEIARLVAIDEAAERQTPTAVENLDPETLILLQDRGLVVDSDGVIQGE